MQYDKELEIMGLTTWQEKVNRLARIFCPDVKDRDILHVETYDCIHHYDYVEMVPQGEWGDYVAVESYRALAERFLLAMELIKIRDENDLAQIEAGN